MPASDPSPLTGTLYLSGFSLSATTTVKFRSYDKVGNQEATGSQLVQVDLTPPSAPALTLTESSPVEYASGTTLYYAPTGSNSGSFNRDRFAVVPETDLVLGFRVTPHIKLLIGYSFLYWSNVVRPGDQIDTVIDPRQLPFSGNPPGRNSRTILRKAAGPGLA